MEIKPIDQIKGRKWIIGMVHVDALPGTPGNNQTISSIIEHAVDDALTLQDAGIDAILIENMHDVPYLKKLVGPEIVACMTAISVELRKKIQVPMGIQILAAANRRLLWLRQQAWILSGPKDSYLPTWLTKVTWKAAQESCSDIANK